MTFERSISTSQHRILIVEDEPKVAESVAARLREEGYSVMVASTGEAGLEEAGRLLPDLAILDLHLPGIGGLEVLRRLRALDRSIRVLVLTSQDSIDDRVTGLDEGADDYLGKPFALTEVNARVKSLFRRGSKPDSEAQSILHIADLRVDRDRRSVSRGGTLLELTNREFNLLLYLLEHRNRPVSREMLAKDVWQETSRFSPIDNVIDVQITRLRRKIDDPFGQKLLQTVRGVGFTLRETP